MRGHRDGRRDDLSAFGRLRFRVRRYNRIAVKIEVDIPVPEEALDAAAKDRLRRDLLEAAVLRLFDERRISSGDAACELWLTRIAFMELARKRQVPMSDYTFDDWKDDQETIGRLWPEIETNVKGSGGGRLK
jgi:predicted HTH domain antitoxin